MNPLTLEVAHLLTCSRKYDMFAVHTIYSTLRHSFKVYTKSLFSVLYGGMNMNAYTIEGKENFSYPTYTSYPLSSPIHISKIEFYR